MYTGVIILIFPNLYSRYQIWEGWITVEWIIPVTKCKTTQTDCTCCWSDQYNFYVILCLEQINKSINKKIFNI